MEQNKSNEWKTETIEQSLSKIASSQYKTQLGTNSIRDELKIIADCLKELVEIQKNK